MDNKKWGVILLCLWLIAEGAVAVVNLTFNSVQIVLGLVAIAAGILIWLGK